MNYIELFPPESDTECLVIKTLGDEGLNLKDLHIKQRCEESFTLRYGYWNEIPQDKLKLIESTFNVEIEQWSDKDSDGFWVYGYEVTP